MLFCRLYEEMKGFLDLDLEIPTSDRALVRDLSKWLKACSKRQRCIIVLDALNQMDEGSKEDGQIQLQSQQSVSNPEGHWQKLAWKQLCPTVSFILSVQMSDNICQNILKFLLKNKRNFLPYIFVVEQILKKMVEKSLATPYLIWKTLE